MKKTDTEASGKRRDPVEVMRSCGGVKVTLGRSEGREQLILETPAGQTITLKDGPGEIEIADAGGNSIRLDASGITITAAAKVTINAGASVEVSAAALNVSAGLSKFSGVVQCDTLVSNSVVSASYSPGAGNLL